jgi:hypothetical protein
MLNRRYFLDTSWKYPTDAPEPADPENLDRALQMDVQRLASLVLHCLEGRRRHKPSDQLVLCVNQTFFQ